MISKPMAILLFELGELQVFHYQTKEEYLAKKPIAQVFYQKKGDKFAHGPFDNLYNAVKAYFTYVPSLPPKNNVIYVDFKKKSRMLE